MIKPTQLSWCTMYCPVTVHTTYTRSLVQEGFSQRRTNKQQTNTQQQQNNNTGQRSSVKQDNDETPKVNE